MRTGIIVLSTMLAVGCGNDDDSGGHADAAGETFDAAVTLDAGPPAFSLDGTVVGNPPANAKAIVLWVVSATSPDYVYKYGQGSSTGAQFAVGLPDAAPPAMALNDYSFGVLGVGIVALVPSDTSVPDGVVDTGGLQLLGASPQHAIIYRTGTFPVELDWPNQFSEAAYECGQCVQEAGGFDSYAPTDCSNVEVDTNSAAEFCNWT